MVVYIHGSLEENSRAFPFQSHHFAELSWCVLHTSHNASGTILTCMSDFDDHHLCQLTLSTYLHPQHN